MIPYSIKQNKPKDKPSIIFEEKYSILNELNSCDEDYIIDEVLPILDKIMNFGQYWDPHRSEHYGYLSTYDFGYTAVVIEFGKDKSIIDDTWDDNFNKIEIPSENIYRFMREWRDYLVEWKKNL